MGAIELKEYIKIQLENADERVLRIVASVFDNYAMENNPNESEILNLLQESENEYIKGKVKKGISVINESREKYS
jgi:histone acetyltransferase (RNA polymerase elongator complex component)